MAAVTNLHQITAALKQHGEDVEREVEGELDVLAQLAARYMRRLAAKSRTHLVNSIHVEKPDALTRDVRPGVGYAEWVEEGVKPGGKGLPAFFSPASADIVEWLKSHPSKGGRSFDRKARKFSRVFQAAMLDLRDRYEGLAWHIRDHGVKAQPFVAPTAKEMEPVVLSRLDLAVRRVLAARPGAGGATA